MAEASLDQSAETGLNHNHSIASIQKANPGCWLCCLSHTGGLVAGEMVGVKEFVVWTFEFLTITMTLIKTTTSQKYQEDCLLPQDFCTHSCKAPLCALQCIHCSIGMGESCIEACFATMDRLISWH